MHMQEEEKVEKSSDCREIVHIPKRNCEERCQPRSVFYISTEQMSKIDTAELKKVLAIFCEKGRYKGAVNSPFRQGDRVFATDRHSLLCIDSKALGIDLSQFDSCKMNAEAVMVTLPVSGYVRTTSFAGVGEKDRICLLGETYISIGVARFLLNALTLLGMEGAAVHLNPDPHKVSYLSLGPGIAIFFMPCMPNNEIECHIVPIDSDMPDMTVRFNHDVASMWIKQEEEARIADEQAQRYIFLVPFVKRACVPVYAKDEKEAQAIAEENGDPGSDSESMWELDDTSSPEVLDINEARESYTEGVFGKDGFLSWDLIHSENPENK